MPRFEVRDPAGRVHTVEAPNHSDAVRQVRERLADPAAAVPPMPAPATIPTPAAMPAPAGLPPTGAGGQRAGLPPGVLAEAQRLSVAAQPQQPVLPGAELRMPQPSIPVGLPPTGLLQQARQTTGDITRAAVHALPVGLGEELTAAGGTPFEMIRGALAGQPVSPGAAYEQLLGRERQAAALGRARTPVGTAIGETAGLTALAGTLGRGGVSFTQGARPTLPSMAVRGGAEGLAYGGAYGFGTGEGFYNRLEGALYGGVFGGTLGGTIGAAARGVDKAWNTLMRKRPAKVPRAADIDDLAQGQYARASAAGVRYGPKFRDEFANQAELRLRQQGYTPEEQPRVAQFLRTFTDNRGQSISLDAVQARRVAAGNLAGSTDAGERLYGVILKQVLDDMVAAPPKGSVLFGAQKQGADALKAANRFYNRARKAEDFEKLIARAQVAADRAENTRPFDAILRSEVTTFLRGLERAKRKGRYPGGYTDAEIDALRAVAKGPVTAATIEKIGKFISPVSAQGLPFKAAIGGAAGTGIGTGAFADPWWLMLGAIGLGGGTALQVGGRLAGRTISAGQQRTAQQLIATGRPPDPLSVGRQRLIQSLVAGGTPVGVNTVR